MKPAAILLGLSSLLLSTCRGHDLCLNGFPPEDRSAATFKICGKYQKNGCCDQEQENAVFNAYSAAIESQAISGKCKELMSELFCQKCSPVSAHLFESGTFEERRFPNLCTDFCSDLRNECGDISAILGENICSTEGVNSGNICYPNSEAKGTEGPRHEPGEEGCIQVCFQTILTGMKNIVGGAFPPDNTDRLFLVQQNGIIWELDSKRNKLDKPFLDITDKVYQNERFDERGLLSMVFHPNFTENKLFYLFYNPRGKEVRSRIVKMKVSSAGSPMVLEEDSEEIILEFTKPGANHNGGQLLFGYDGYLYISTGDGGGQRDDHGSPGNGQSLTTFLGKILRIDVDTRHGYEIPPDNPFVGSSGDEFKEIYAYGFRNPWRMTLDKVTGEIFVGDVGQTETEEVNVIVKGGNYGWRAFEGEKCFDRSICSTSLKDANLQEPVYEYSHRNGLRAVIGGYVYRGKGIPQLEGKYVFGDWTDSRQLRALENMDGDWVRRDLCIRDQYCPEDKWAKEGITQLFGFTEDEEGEIYALVAGTNFVYNEDSIVVKLIPSNERTT